LTKSTQKRQFRELTPSKKRIFFVVTAAFPFFLLIVTELALRWFDYGPDLSLFKRHEIHGQPYYLMNPDVKFRYFGSLNFTPTTSPDYFPVTKPARTYRIFCLGGSTTVGYPYWYNGSFSSFLRDRLTTAFPGKNIEVINLGMTATNSFTVLDMAEELTSYEPDLILVYDGHNEFYGALGAASRQSVGSSRFMARLYLRLVHVRIFQLVRDGIQKLGGLFSGAGQPISRGTMMETLARDRYVPYGSSAYQTTYAALRQNLMDLRELCLSKRISLIIGTQVSNLRDRAPFVSNNSPSLLPQEKSEFQRSYPRGVELRRSGNIDSSIVFLMSAIAADSLHADAHYQLAKSLEEKGHTQDALSHYIHARDYDELRFRTDSKFNELIRSMDDEQGCFVADIERAFKTLSPDSLVGSNLIFEHLHPNARGYFVIAKQYAEAMRRQGLLASPQEWDSADTLNEERLWKNRCVTELDERVAARRTEVLTSGWPFKDQFPTVDPIPTTDTLGQIAEKTTEGQLDWKSAHMAAISFYNRRGDRQNVEREYKAINTQIPLDPEPYMELARMYFEQQRSSEMEAVLLASLKVEPTIQAYRTLGDITLQKGDPAAALKFYERMDGFVQTPTEKLQNGYMICVAYARAKQFEKAKERLLQVLKLKPDYQPAIELLIEVNKQSELK